MLEQIAVIVREVFSNYVDVSTLDADTPFDTLEIDSLVRVELALTLKESVGFADAEARVKHAANIRELAAMYEEGVASVDVAAA